MCITSVTTRDKVVVVHTVMHWCVGYVRLVCVGRNGCSSATKAFFLSFRDRAVSTAAKAHRGGWVAPKGTLVSLQDCWLKVSTVAEREAIIIGRIIIIKPNPPSAPKLTIYYSPFTLQVVLCNHADRAFNPSIDHDWFAINHYCCS